MVIKSSQTNNLEETIAFEWFAIIYPFAVQLCLVAVTNFTLGHSTFSKQHISVDRFRWEIREIFFSAVFKIINLTLFCFLFEHKHKQIDK